MGDDEAAAPSAAEKWIEEQIKSVDVAGMRQDEALREQNRWRAALLRHVGVIERLLGQYKRIVPFVLPEDNLVLVAKPGGGVAAKAHRRFVDESMSPNHSGAFATLAYALEFTVFPEPQQAEALFEEWPGVPDKIAVVANDLCGTGARRLGK